LYKKIAKVYKTNMDTHMVRWMKVGMQISNTECHIPHKPIKYHIVGENGNSAKSRSKLWEVFPRPNTHINFAKMLFFKGFPIFLSSGAGPRLVACIEYALIPVRTEGIWAIFAHSGRAQGIRLWGMMVGCVDTIVMEARFGGV
jgi:hypothetical protein